MSPVPSDAEDNTHPTTKTEPSKSHKKRSTMNSRDSAYDYSAGLGISAPIDDDKDDEGSVHGSRLSSDGRKRRGKRVAEDDDEETSPSANPRGKRRRGSHDSPDDPPDPVPDLPVPRPKPAKKSHKKQVREDPPPSPSRPPSDRGSTTPLLEPPPRANKGGRPPGPGKRKSNLARAERVDSEEPGTPTFRRGGDEFRPARARVPQARSGLNEMRKRVGAILEFVGRLRVESEGGGTPAESTVRETMRVTQELDGPIEKPDLDSAPSLVIMDYLTKRCLDFELKFGKFPGRYG